MEVGDIAIESTNAGKKIINLNSSKKKWDKPEIIILERYNINSGVAPSHLEVSSGLFS